MKFKILIASLLIVIIAAVINAQEPVPKSASEKVLPDAEAKLLFESLRAHEMRSLSFLPRLYVVSDRVNRDLITQGFKIDEMIKSIEVSLNNVGLKTVDFDVFKTMGKEGYPFLKLKVEVSQDKGAKNDNSYSGLIKVALTQRVVMYRLTNTTAVAGPRQSWTSSYYPDTAYLYGETWHTQKCVTNESRENIARMVVDIVVNDFIKDYQKARQK